MMIKVEGISFKYGTNKLLDNLSFYVKKGEIVSLVGRSGSGKTTLFRLLTGLRSADEGTIIVNGSATYMTQLPLLMPWRTVLDNLMLLAELGHDIPMEKVRFFLNEVGLSGCENKYPKELSGGMQSRVCLARALLEDKELLLLDEPFAFLDAITREEMQNLVVGLQQKYHKSVLLVTHDIHEALQISNRVYLLADGTIKNEWHVPKDPMIRFSLASSIKQALV